MFCAFCNHIGNCSRTFILTAILVVLLTTLSTSPARAQAPPPAPAAAKDNLPDPRTCRDVELMFGPLIPARNGLQQTVPGWGVTYSEPTNKGVFEAGLYLGNGNAISYKTASFDYRMDLQVETVYAHFLLGVHADQFNQGDPYPESKSFAGGWEFGGGGTVPLAGPLYLRFDFRDRFSPGQILEVTVGLTYRMPQAQGNGP